MTTPDHKGHFGDSAAAQPELLDAAQYYRLLAHLLYRGEGYGKTQPVAAFLLRNLRLLTSTESGKDEVLKEINVEPLYLVMDIANFPTDYVQQLVVKDIMSKYALRIIGEGALNDPDFKGAGLWTIKKSSFEGDYISSPDQKNQYNPNPDAFRVCLTMHEPVVIPTSWGEGFLIEDGGTLAIRERDVEDLSLSLQAIATGKVSPKEALLNEDGTAKFDVYGMNPGFIENNYQPVELKERTQDSVLALHNYVAEIGMDRRFQ